MRCPGLNVRSGSNLTRLRCTRPIEEFEKVSSYVAAIASKGADTGIETPNSSLHLCVTFSQPLSGLSNSFSQLNQHRAIRSRVQLFVEFDFSTEQLVCILVKPSRVAATNSKIAISTL